MDEIDYTFKKAITTAVGGSLEQVFIVQMCSPVKKALRYTYTLQQYIAKAYITSSGLFASLMKDAPQVQRDRSTEEVEEVEEKESAMSGSDVMTLLITGNVDIDACLNEFEKLAFKGCIKVNGETINKPQFNKIDDEDLEGLFAEFIANFIAPSALSKI